MMMRAHSHKKLWEFNMGKEISTDVYENIWNIRILKSISVRIKENLYKSIWGWYLTPVKLNQINVFIYCVWHNRI